EMHLFPAEQRGAEAGGTRPMKGETPALLLPAEARRQHVELSRVRARRRRLQVAHGRKRALQEIEQLTLGAALQHLGKEGAAGRGAEVNDARARLQEPVLLVDLGELVGRA